MPVSFWGVGEGTRGGGGGGVEVIDAMNREIFCCVFEASTC